MKGVFFRLFFLFYLFFCFEIYVSLNEATGRKKWRWINCPVGWTSRRTSADGIRRRW